MCDQLNGLYVGKYTTVISLPWHYSICRRHSIQWTPLCCVGCRHHSACAAARSRGSTRICPSVDSTSYIRATAHHHQLSSSDCRRARCWDQSCSSCTRQTSHVSLNDMVSMYTSMPMTPSSMESVIHAVLHHWAVVILATVCAPWPAGWPLTDSNWMLQKLSSCDTDVYRLNSDTSFQPTSWQSAHLLLFIHCYFCILWGSTGFRSRTFIISCIILCQRYRQWCT